MLLACAALFTACAKDDSFHIQNWTLSAPGEITPRQVTLPQYLNRFLPNHHLTYFLDADVTLPDAMRGEKLTFAIPFLPGIAELRVDGEQVTVISSTLTQVYRATGPQAFALPARLTQQRVVHLELRVDHSYTQSGWFESVPSLTRRPNGNRDYLVSRLLVEGGALACLGSLTTTGFIYLVIFTFNRRRKEYGIFALQAWTACTYPFFTLGLSQRLFGQWDMPILAITLGIAPLAGIYFTHAEFDLPPPSRVWRLLLLGCVAAALIAPGPFVVLVYAAPAVMIVVLTAVVYQLFTLGKIVRQRRDLTAGLLFAAWLALGFGASVDGAAWLGLFETLNGVRCAAVSLTLFALLQSAALSHEHFLTTATSDALNINLTDKLGQLTAHQTEVVRLNVELRRQVAERSRELSDALHHLAADETGAKMRRLAVDEVIQDRYRVVGEIGEGGMGTVYEVERLSDRQHFALKATMAVSGTGSLALARLAREAQIAGSLNHPNIVSIIDVDIATTGFLYIVMELIRGKPLSEERELCGDKQWCLIVLKQIAEGLAALHAQGVIHRDLKPSNILLRGARTHAVEVKIADFGISSLAVGEVASEVSPEVMRERATRAAVDLASTATQNFVVTPTTPEPRKSPPSGGSLTRTGIVMGTPLYMAPELAQGVNVAQSSADLFSLGVIAYEVLVGKRPYEDADCLARFSGVLLSVFRCEKFVDHCPYLSRELAMVFDLTLAENPLTRPSARQIADALGTHIQRNAHVSSG